MKKVISVILVLAVAGGIVGFLKMRGKPSEPSATAVPVAEPETKAPEKVESKPMVKTEQPAPTSSSTDWTTFRGPDGNDISPDTGLLKEWPADGPKQAWVFEDAGMGYSGFAVVDGKLYTMGTKGTEVHMVCVNTADGSGVWSTSFANDDSKGYNAGWGNGPRGTPTYSDGKVYGLGPKGVLVCINASDGSKVWDKDLIRDFGGKPGSWGFSESPLVDGNKLIVAPGGDQAGVVALDKNTGEVIWAANEVKPGKAEYATIVISEMNGTRQYIKVFEKIIVSAGAATGKVLHVHRAPQNDQDELKQQYRDRRAKLGKFDVQGHFELALWCVQPLVI